MIKNIIFDIGDVLVKSNYHEFFLGKGYDEKTVAQLEKATFFSPAWKELDRGVWDFDEIIDAFVKNAPQLEKPLKTVFDDMNGFVKIYPYTIDWIRDLKSKGLKIYCLSNISDKICHDCAKDMEFLKFTDGNILSYKEKLIKPNSAIFRLLLDRYNLIANDCIFIDDIAENITSAEKLGIKGIVFKNQQQVINEIETIWRTENE